MTPEQIEAALEQPEFNSPLAKMAALAITLEKTANEIDDMDVEDMSLSDIVADILCEIEHSFCDNMSLPFSGEETGAFPVDTVKKVYQGIKARLLSPEYRLKAALKSGAAV